MWNVDFKQMWRRRSKEGIRWILCGSWHGPVFILRQVFFMWMKWHFSLLCCRGMSCLYAGKRHELVRRKAMSNDCCVWTFWSDCLAHEKAAIFMHHVSRSLITTGSWKVAINWCRRCNTQADICLALLPGFYSWQLMKCCNNIKSNDWASWLYFLLIIRKWLK